MVHSLNFARQGDKQNSAFFEEYLQRLLEERDSSGLTEMIREIDAIMITVDPGHSIRYIGELALMTPYHYLVTLECEDHWTHVLRVDMNSPDILVREVKDPSIKGIFRSLNEVYPIGMRKPNSRYMGEVLRVTNLHEVVECQQQREFRFFSQEQIRKLQLPGNMAVSKPSPYTHNIVGYMERPEDQIRTYALGMSSIRDDVQEVYLAAKAAQEELGIDGLIQPIDHLATRVYCQNREVAILEWLSLSSYYYWGSYDIKDQNSSTNVTKSVHFGDEIYSPAKVFTANNTPYFVNHLERLPSPTETFVRNYGPRLHHLAIGVNDGEQHGMENIDYVVDAIDTLSPKIFLIYHARQRGLKLASSMGCGGKLDPSQIRVADFADTYNCRLAYVLRKKLRKLDVNGGFKAVFSSEQVPRHPPNLQRLSSILYSRTRR